jgi:CDP-diacylglycerol--serine O-phosphatidyltransferase
MNLSNAKYILPNLVTLSSGFAAFCAIVRTAQATDAAGLTQAVWLLALSMFLDGCDGRVARATKSQSEFGVQLDSLADGIAFGIAPAFLLYRWAFENSGLGLMGLLIPFLFGAAGILRLARFNVLAAKDKGSSDHFVGLPIPLAAGALLSVILTHLSLTGKMETAAPWSAALITVVLSFLMVSTVRYRTFKKSGRKTSLILVSLLLSALVASVVFNPGLPFALLFAGYILVGLTESAVEIGRRRAARHEDELEDELEDEEPIEHMR